MRSEPTDIKSSNLLRGFTFSFFMTNALIISFFPTYFVSMGYSKTQIGLIYSIGPTISILSNLFWGYISDKYHTMKKTIVAVLIGQLCLALFLFQMNSYFLIFIAMIGFYFFQTPLNTLNDSQLLLYSSKKGASYASFRVWGSIGFAASALVFGIMLQSQKEHPQLIALLTISTIGLSLLLSLLLKDSRGNIKKIEFSGLFQILLSRKLIIFLSLILVLAISHRANDAFLSLYLHELGASQALIGYSWTVSALSEIPIFFLLSRYGDRYKELPLLALASFAFVIRYLLMSITIEPHYIIMIQALHSITFGIFLFTAFRYITQIVPDQYRATGQAIFTVVYSGMAGLISSLLGGLVFDRWGGHTLYIVASAIAFVAGIGFLLAHFKDQDSG
ncbi:MFS transporter [Paenibacillus psychroresistens]|uniref:MFS transporter n=1 Tax=Paenibacillus psychroresistens TaxID=1778678 RepID=A0A6B8RPZ3_9BACL|nr:MFS transporter [Paenibacillus psychroresistens]QGQ97456.1 MFS transporter [Paenibacillus psychroresistens]